MKTLKKVLQVFGFYNHSKFMESSMTTDNIHALALISGMAMFAAVLSLHVSYTNADYAIPLYRVTNYAALTVSLIVLILTLVNQKRIQISFHAFHAGLFLYVEWLTFCGMTASFVDSMHRGGFIAFLITQVWAFDLVLIPPFVSILLCGTNFLVFMTLISHLAFFPPAKYVETFIFYVTIVSVNFFHYRNTLVKVYQQEEMIDTNRRLDHLSTTDELTSARNRVGLRNDFEHLFSDHLYVMMCDIDNFKKYNDVFGHQIGDQVLSDYARCLKDVFGADRVYRYGGDEFLVITDMPISSAFETMARQASELYNSMVPDKEKERARALDHPTSSCGYVYGPCHNTDVLRAMIKAADYQLYQAKSRGKNQISGAAFNGSTD